MSLEPIENPSKCSRKRSARTAFDGISHIMMTRSPFCSAREALRFEQRDDLRGLAQRAHERDHHLHVGEAHVVANALHRRALEREAIVELRRDVARCAAKSEHRILFVRLVALAADQVRVFVRLEVGKPDDHLLRPERRGDRRHTLGDLADVELGRTRIAADALPYLALQLGRLLVDLDQRLRVDPDILVDDEFQPREADALVRELAKLERELGIADVHHDLRGHRAACDRARHRRPRRREGRHRHGRCRLRRTTPSPARRPRGCALRRRSRRPQECRARAR